MVVTDVITILSLLSLGGIIGVAGFRRLFRLDCLRWEYVRQNGCRWHRWQVLEQGPGQLDHVARVDVDGRPVHGLEHRVRDVGRSRDAQELSTVGDCHSRGLP